MSSHKSFFQCAWEGSGIKKLLCEVAEGFPHPREPSPHTQLLCLEELGCGPAAVGR